MIRDSISATIFLGTTRFQNSNFFDHHNYQTRKPETIILYNVRIVGSSSSNIIVVVVVEEKTVVPPRIESGPDQFVHRETRL